jgi:hypothetical protein
MAKPYKQNLEKTKAIMAAMLGMPTTQIIQQSTPWEVYYDNRIYVSVRTFASDIVKSIHGPRGYLQDLQKDATSRAHFRQCMKHYFPKM